MKTFKDINIIGRTEVVNKAAIFQKLEILLSSYKNSNFFYREYHCDIRDILFMPLNRGSANLLEMRLRQCITKHIPEIIIESINVNPYYENRTLDVKISGSLLNGESFEYLDELESKIK